MNELVADEFLAYTIGIVVFFAGVHLNKRIPLLRAYNIPEPVTGGLLAAITVFALYLLTGFEITFELSTRDRLLVYFFTAIGLNARVSNLIQGGKPLLTLLGLTLSFIVIQNLIGMAGVTLLGLPKPVGILTGSASLIGGHGTSIAWAPEIVKMGVENALEIGVACATLGLVIASLIGGPIARRLIARHDLSGNENQARAVGLGHDEADHESINHLSIMGVILALHTAIILGYIVNHAIAAMGFKLPLFVACLLVAIIMSSTIPRLFPAIHWPAESRALALVSDFSLSLFLAMSLMSMKLWTLADLAGPLLAILALQTLGAVLFVRFAVFPAMGGDYRAAVLSAGFGGFALGATPTAVANMTAVTKAHGPAPSAFIILPLVSAFFLDIANAVVIQFLVSQ